ncbi:MAG TPA: aminotransferase class I/II-fold pyridoxal phosphate-dependent enzyme, partial [Acidimicrobiales bacterium]
VTSPNNPTGTAVTHAELEHLLDAVPADCLVVLDEAYHEYTTGAHVPRALELLAAHPNLAVLRTFSKAFGLAALRVGYLFAHADVVAAVDRTLVPFAVNGLGQVAALASLDADDELLERVNHTLIERERVARALRTLGLSVPDPQGNFVWLPAGDATTALTMKLEGMGVVVRPFPGEGIRVTIGLPEENARFLDGLDACIDPLDLPAHWQLPTGELARTVQSWVDRADAAQERLVEHAVRRHEGLTQPDPGGEEQWEEGNVWGHLSEIGGYWLAQLRQVVDAASAEPVPFGRTKVDEARRAAVAEGPSKSVGDHLVLTQRALDELRAYVAGLGTADWVRVGRHSTLGDMDVATQLAHFHIGHVEQHLDQLDGLAVREG